MAGDDKIRAKSAKPAPLPLGTRQMLGEPATGVQPNTKVGGFGRVSSQRVTDAVDGAGRKQGT